MLSGTVLLLLFLVLMFMGIPVAHSMIITAYITIKFVHPEIPTIIVAQRLFGGADNYISPLHPLLRPGRRPDVHDHALRPPDPGGQRHGRAHPGRAFPHHHRGGHVLRRHHRGGGCRTPRRWEPS
ncbi:MAG: hypothetical protein MZU79_08885 [Anaerotruncus sp.]|nr:hypothetical protein [Anaerotruncus sp.]